MDAHQPGTGPDWANAIGPHGTRPLPPATTRMRVWGTIRGNQTPTDREYLAHLRNVIIENNGDAEWASAIRESAAITNRAMNGHHDGSLPELGHYRPVYFVPDHHAAAH